MIFLGCITIQIAICIRFDASFVFPSFYILLLGLFLLATPKLHKTWMNTSEKPKTRK